MSGRRRTQPPKGPSEIWRAAVFRSRARKSALVAGLGLVLGVAWDLGRRPGSPPELTLEEARVALAWVRALSEAKTSGRPPPAPPRELAGRSSHHPVFITLYGADGRGRTDPRIGRYAPPRESPPASLAQALALATEDLLHQLDTRGIALEPPGQSTLKVDLAGAPRRLGLKTSVYLDLVLDRGQDGLTAQLGPNQIFVLPAQPLEQGTRWASLVAELDRLSGGAAKLSSFRTRSFVEGPPSEPGPWPVFRGNVLAAEVTAPVVRQSLLDAARYLVRSLGPDGRYCYMYRAEEDRCEDDYNLLRHAGTTYCLYQLARVLGLPELFGPAEQASEWLRAQTREVEGDPSRVFLLEGDLAKLGAVGLAVLRDGRDRELLGKLGRFLVSQQNNDGYFRSFFRWRADLEVPTHNSIYYPGEALLALVRLYRIAPDPSILGAATRGADFLVRRRWRWAGMELFVPPDAWLAQALAELDAITRADWLRDYAYRIVEVTQLTMLRASEGASPDLIGGPASGPIFPGVTPAGARNEATTAVWQMARRRGEAERAAGLRELALLSARFQLSQQFRATNSYFLPQPLRARGGFRATAVDHGVRIDYVQHNVTGLIGVLDMLEDGR
jgi:hypothetical protein